MSLKDRWLWPDCATAGTHDLCPGSFGNAECICWHHVTRQRLISRTETLLNEVRAEIDQIERLERDSRRRH